MLLQSGLDLPKISRSFRFWAAKAVEVCSMRHTMMTDGSMQLNELLWTRGKCPLI